ncbi:MAG TPA: DNA integrity scanning protein DisA nucleotide-binding domain protein [Solidesulfovibrio magneticus]|nr:DNA integrity scanning protein DisA nucleotide-binding domain protein [Solidesulfovibrio magneticus]
MQASTAFAPTSGPAGPLELAARLIPNPSVLSDRGLAALVETAYRASLKREEGRYPSFQLFSPLAGGAEPVLDLRFSPPQPCTLPTLHRLSPGIPPGPYAFVAKEGPEGLRLEGVSKVEYSGFAALRGRIDYHGGTQFPGLSLSVSAPGKLRASLVCPDQPALYLELREGRLSVCHDNAFSPVFLPLCRQAAQTLTHGAEDSGALASLVKATLARVFALAVAAGHGGMFVFLPPGRAEAAAARTLLSPGVGVAWPNLGRVAQNLAGAGGGQAVHLEQWDTATRVTAQASCVDGAVILDAALSVQAFRVELLARDEDALPLCLSLSPQSTELVPTASLDIAGFGTRHRSAARYVARASGAVAVVVSQDGEMREFVRLPDGRVGVCGPLAPMSVSAPAA